MAPPLAVDPCDVRTSVRSVRVETLKTTLKLTTAASVEMNVVLAIGDVKSKRE
jgi:hypothetical protein